MSKIFNLEYGVFNMDNDNKLKAFLDSLSFRDLTITVELLITGYVLYFYATELLTASTVMREDPSWVSGLLLKVVVISIIVSIAGRVLLDFVSDDNVDKPLDERQRLIALAGLKPAYWVLQSGVCIAIFQYTAEAHGWPQGATIAVPFLALHILVVSFLLAELVGYGTQLVQAHRGASYG